jgi:uncharacterized membrane protein YhhN
MKGHPARKYHLWGWYLFIVSAAFFIASSLSNGDWLSFFGGLLFLIACVIFLIPLMRDPSSEE